MSKVAPEEHSQPLSPSFKQNEGSFFQKQKALSNKMALTPTKQRLIRASTITSMFDLNQLNDPKVFTNHASISAPRFDTQNNNEEEFKRLVWQTPGILFDVGLLVYLRYKSFTKREFADMCLAQAQRGLSVRYAFRNIHFSKQLD